MDIIDKLLKQRNAFYQRGDMHKEIIMTEAINEITALRQQVAKLQAGISEYDQLVTVSNSRIVDLQKNLAIAIKALENIRTYKAMKIADEALNKIRSK